VSSTPHHPRRGTSKRNSECQHLDTGIPLESGVGNDAILDGIRSSSTNSYGAEHLEDRSKNHGLSVGD
jgi:hypothetical protein